MDFIKVWSEAVAFPEKAKQDKRLWRLAFLCGGVNCTSSEVCSHLNRNGATGSFYETKSVHDECFVWVQETRTRNYYLLCKLQFVLTMVYVESE